VGGLNCRDRNRVALEGELAALADAGAAAVHCVTGDHTAIGHRPDAAPVFDLDATRLAAAARAAGLLVSVAESPCARPAARPPGPAGREGAGGCPGVRREPRGRDGRRSPSSWPPGRRSPTSRAFPWCSDRAGAAARAFPGLVLPPGFLAGILDARDPVVAGIDAAVRLAENCSTCRACRASTSAPCPPRARRTPPAGPSPR
jgi:hypothetical protein